MNAGARIAHRISVALMGVGVLIATADGFAHSYKGLYDWAAHHHLEGWKLDTFPLLVDLFILVGELGLFALALEGHKVTRRGLSWLDMILPFGLAAGGWSVSLAFNVGAAHDTLSDQVTAAVAPIASMLGLLVLLRTVHRLVGAHADTGHFQSVVGHVAEGVAELAGRVAEHTGTAALDAPAIGHLRTVSAPDADHVAEPVAEVAEPVADDPADTTPEEPKIDHPGQVSDTGSTADQAASHDLETAVRSAKADGLSVRAIADAYGITRYRVSRLLNDPGTALEPAVPDSPAALNGHRPATDDHSTQQ